MASITIDPEGGNPTGAPQIGNNQKEANEAPQSIELPGPDANTAGALKLTHGSKT
jgi:hypothetical protein